jgi:hypothetical protein
MTPTGIGQPAPIGVPKLPTTEGTMPLVPAGVPTGGRGSPPPAEPIAPAYEPPPVLKDPTPPPPPATSGATPIAPVSPPTAEAAPSAPALPAGGSVAAPISGIEVPSMPLDKSGK